MFSHRVVWSSLLVAACTGAHRPLCDPSVVQEMCSKHDGPSGSPATSIAKDSLAKRLSASPRDMAAAWEALGLEGDVQCQALCDAIVEHVQRTGGVLPPRTDTACYRVNGATVCDLDVSPQRILQQLASPRNTSLGPSSQDRLPDHKLGAPAGEATAPHPVLGRFGNTLEVRRTVSETVEIIAGLFRMFPAVTQHPQVHLPMSNISLDVAATSVPQSITLTDARARAWMVLIIGDVSSGRSDHLVNQHFGGGAIQGAELRNQVMQRLNYIQNQFAKGVRYAFPGPGICNEGSGTVAYVYSYNKKEHGEFRPNAQPRCNPSDDPLTKACGVDTTGRSYVYVCAVFDQPGMVQDFEGLFTSVFIHELSHHAGTYDIGEASAHEQWQKLGSAYVYQNFATDLIYGKYHCDGVGKNCRLPQPGDVPTPTPVPDAPTPPPGPCLNTDPHCDYYASVGYCTYEHIQTDCPLACQLCQPCVDNDPNCDYYKNLGYCSTVPNIQANCRKKCGLCVSNELLVV